MGYGPIKVFSVTMTSGATLTSELNLAQWWGTIFLSVPSMTSNSQIHIQGASDSAGTYRRVAHPVVNSSTIAAPNDFTISSAATNRMILVPTGFQYLKIETTATVDSGQTFKLICSE